MFNTIMVIPGGLFMEFLLLTHYINFYEQIPVGRDQIYHEVELGVVIGKTGVSISESQAMDHVGGYTLALDMTDLDLVLEKVSKQSGNDTYVILCDGLLHVVSHSAGK